VELKSGELYRGSMIECEDNWNCQLESITYTAKVPFSSFYPYFFFFYVKYDLVQDLIEDLKFGNATLNWVLRPGIRDKVGCVWDTCNN